MVELRKARATDTPVCECTICCLGVSEWLYKMVAVRSQWWMCGGFPRCTEVSRVKRAMEISKVKEERKVDVQGFPQAVHLGP